MITSRLLRDIDYGSSLLFFLCVENRLFRYEFLSFYAPGLRENLASEKDFLKVNFFFFFPNWYRLALGQKM